MPEPRAGEGATHEGRQERWVPTAAARDTDGREYVRWVCSCGETSEPFTDNGDCEADWRLHAGLIVCAMCEEAPAVTVWGAPVCRPCAEWLGALDVELQVEETFAPDLAEKGRLVDESARRFFEKRGGS